MKHLFIINPAAGSWDHTKQYTAAIVESCNARGLDYRVEVSKAPGECRRITREAGETGEEYRVYACGGDGTLNEVASGAAGFPNLAITAYSGGSGNDFVRLFSEPAAFSDLERLLDAKEVTFDMIRCNDDYALNICSVGLDARIGTDVARYKRLPLLQGFRAYAASTVVNVVRGIAEHYVVEICGETVDAQQTIDLRLQRAVLRRRLQPRAGGRPHRRAAGRASGEKGEPSAGVLHHREIQERPVQGLPRRHPPFPD